MGNIIATYRTHLSAHIHFQRVCYEPSIFFLPPSHNFISYRDLNALKYVCISTYIYIFVLFTILWESSNPFSLPTIVIQALHKMHFTLFYPFANILFYIYAYIINIYVYKSESWTYASWIFSAVAVCRLMKKEGNEKQKKNPMSLCVARTEGSLWDSLADEGCIFLYKFVSLYRLHYHK